jgi:AcrR family transcriptional regulator
MVVDQTAEPRRRLSAEDRRTAILEAAREVFARRGFHGGLTSEIASVAGCSEPMLYKHFPSKQALFAAVLEAAGEEMCLRVEALTAQSDDPLRSLADVFHSLRREPRVLEIMRLRMLAVTLVDDNPDIRAALETTANRMRKRVAKAVADQQAAGAVRPDVDPEQVAWLYFGIVISAGFRYAVYGDRAHKSFSQLPETLLTLLKTPASKEVSS